MKKSIHFIVMTVAVAILISTSTSSMGGALYARLRDVSTKTKINTSNENTTNGAKYTSMPATTIGADFSIPETSRVTSDKFYLSGKIGWLLDYSGQHNIFCTHLFNKCSTKTPET